MKMLLVHSSKNEHRELVAIVNLLLNQVKRFA